VTAEHIAVAAERRWAIVVGAIIVVLVLMMIVTGVHWASMPPSRVETVDPRTLHVAGEFVDSSIKKKYIENYKVAAGLAASGDRTIVREKPRERRA